MPYQPYDPFLHQEFPVKRWQQVPRDCPACIAIWSLTNFSVKENLKKSCRDCELKRLRLSDNLIYPNFPNINSNKGGRSMPPFRDEHVLIIAPGSQTTQAQLGLPESFTPAKWRFPTRMFPGDREGQFEPTKIIRREVTVTVPVEPNGDSYGIDTEMEDSTTREMEDSAAKEKEDMTTTEIMYEDDVLSSEGAIYPIEAGVVVNWPCLFALLEHIHNTLSPPFHVPVLVVAQPCWSAKDYEMITQFFFEHFKIPAFCVVDSAVTALWAYGVQTACVVDVGLDKCDITAVVDFHATENGRTVALKDCGGGDMTRRLHSLLADQGFDEEMCEQLKRSPICEILPIGTPLPMSSAIQQILPEQPNPAAAASTGATESGADAKNAEGLRPGEAPRGPGIGTDVGQEGENGDEEEEEGVFNVAAIVAKDNAAELLAKREKEKAERAAAKKGALDAARVVRLKNAERYTGTFVYEELEPYQPAENGNPSVLTRKRKRDVTVGVERFMAASRPNPTADTIMDTVSAAIHSTIMNVTDISARSALWENMIIAGKGSQIRGFQAALLATLAARYTLSPSTATMFTSELPSNFSTPLPTNGTNTPVPGQQGSQQLHHSSAHGVNPLLVAATKHAMQPQSQHLQIPGGQDSHHHSHRGHSQTPTSIKTGKLPDYFPEWKNAGVAVEEASFLGAQVVAKIIFVVDQGSSKGFLTRGEFNELGPAGIHDCSL